MRGGAGAVAWTAIASNGAAPRQAAAAVADQHLDVGDAEEGERVARPGGEGSWRSMLITSAASRDSTQAE